MARPRVFVSSTFYDLRWVRNDLELFIAEIGYEPILNERGSIPYGTSEKLEEYAYQEVDRSDIVVAVIGGRFGAQSNHNDHSISNYELTRALAAGKQVYIFIEASVRAEYQTYLLNKHAPDTKYHFVDDVRVYQFIEEIYGLPQNNTIAPFESAADITTYLREQWAGLFQRFLDEQRKAVDQRAAEDLVSTANTLRQVATSLAARQEGETQNTLHALVFANHPIFARLKRLLNVPYRVFFSSRGELTAWLKGSQGFDDKVPSSVQDKPDIEEWLREVTPAQSGQYDLLKVNSAVFGEDGLLRSSIEKCYDLASRNFAAYPKAELIRGRVPDTLEDVRIDQVCYLSIDMNIAEPEVAAIEFFWEKLVPGAIVLLDDYGWLNYSLQKERMDQFASGRSVKILSMPTGQGLLIKP